MSDYEVADGPPLAIAQQAPGGPATDLVERLDGAPERTRASVKVWRADQMKDTTRSNLEIATLAQLADSLAFREDSIEKMPHKPS